MAKRRHISKKKARKVTRKRTRLVENEETRRRRDDDDGPNLASIVNVAVLGAALSSDPIDPSPASEPTPFEGGGGSTGGGGASGEF